MRADEDLDKRLAYSPQELADVLGISLTFLYALWRDRQGPQFAKVKGRRLISRASAERWLEEQSNGVELARQRKEKRQGEIVKHKQR